MGNPKVGKNMFSKNIIFLIGFLLMPLTAVAEDQCSLFELRISDKEFKELFDFSSYREYSPIRKILISNYSNENGDFKLYFDEFIKSNKGEIKYNSIDFKNVISRLRLDNLQDVLLIYGDDNYNKLTNLKLEFGDRVRGKDILSHMIMIRYGEDLWVNSYPFPFWNININKNKSKFIKENRFVLSKSQIIKPIPPLKYGPTWNFNQNINQEALLNGFYDKNSYYLWLLEYKKNNLKYGEWNRDIKWFIKLKQNYKGDDENLKNKLNKLTQEIMDKCK